MTDNGARGRIVYGRVYRKFCRRRVCQKAFETGVPNQRECHECVAEKTARRLNAMRALK